MRRGRRGALLRAGGALLLVLAGACSDPLADLPPLPIGGELELATAGGGALRLADHPDEVKLIFFGYASCPEICPTTLARLARVQTALGERSRGLFSVFVSVDPERDSPERLAEFVHFFGIRGAGATGTPERIAALAKAYGAFYERVEGPTAAQYLIDHSTFIYLVDQRDRVRRLVRSDDSVEQIADWVRRLLDHPAG